MTSLSREMAPCRAGSVGQHKHHWRCGRGGRREHATRDCRDIRSLCIPFERVSNSIGTTRWLAGFGRHRRLVVRATVCLIHRMLDPSECERARVARDRRYDGRFFTGVRTTKIYCRPVCPVRPAQAKNVMFFPSAAAAVVPRHAKLNGIQARPSIPKREAKFLGASGFRSGCVLNKNDRSASPSHPHGQTIDTHQRTGWRPSRCARAARR